MNLKAERQRDDQNKLMERMTAERRDKEHSQTVFSVIKQEQDSRIIAIKSTPQWKDELALSEDGAHI